MPTITWPDGNQLIVTGHGDVDYTADSIPILDIGDAGDDGVATILSSDIDDFEEAVEDVVGAALVDSSSIDVTYDDALGTFSFSVITEWLQDTVGAMFTDGTNIDFTYDDPTGTITAALIGTIADARLSSNVPLKDGSPVFTTAIEVSRSLAASNALVMRVDGDTQFRGALRADGRFELGSGSAARDWVLAYQTTALAGITGSLNVSGKVGIALSTLGTTPSAALHVQQSGSGTQDVIAVANNTTPNTGIGPAILFITASGGSVNAGRLACLYNGSNVYYLSLQAQKAAAGGPVELMRLLAGGPVMIGTTVNSGAGEYELVLPNAKNLRGLNAAGTSSLPLIGKDSSDRTVLGLDTKSLVLSSASTQTTVGAAGGASALPATPTKYLRVRESSTEYVVPLYAQA